MTRIIKVPHSGFVALTVAEFESSPTCDERIVCLNSQEMTIIRKAIEPFYWPTRYGEFVTPGRFQVAPNNALVEALERLETKMGCNDLSDAVLALAGGVERGLLAIANKPCCDDNQQIVINVNGGVNGTLPDGTPTYGTEPTVDPPETFPPGYEDEAQYRVSQCAMAHAMVTGLVLTFDALTGITGVNAIAATIGVILAAIPIFPVSPVLIPVLVPIVAVAWLASGVLHAVSLEIEAERESLVCALISGNGVGVMTEMLAEVFDLIIQRLDLSGPVGMAVKGIAMVLVNGDTLNQLYAQFSGYIYPEADCEFCDEVECPVALHFISETATPGLASLVRLAWDGSTLIGTSGTWGENCELRFLAEDLFPVVGSEFKAQYVRVRMTVYLPENANSEFYYGINDEWVTVLSGNNGTGPHTYEVDWTASADEVFEQVFFYGNSLYREWQLSNIKIDIPCESIIA